MVILPKSKSNNKNEKWEAEKLNFLLITWFSLAYLSFF
jgi:hypothetical protein